MHLPRSARRDAVMSSTLAARSTINYICVNRSNVRVPGVRLATALHPPFSQRLACTRRVRVVWHPSIHHRLLPRASRFPESWWSPVSVVHRNGCWICRHHTFTISLNALRILWTQLYFSKAFFRARRSKKATVKIPNQSLKTQTFSTECRTSSTSGGSTRGGA